MHADKLIRAFAVLGQTGDRQGRGVGGKDNILADDRFGFLDHVGFDIGTLEHRFDDQVDIFQIIIIVGRGDPGHEGVCLVLRHLATLDALVDDLLAVIDGFLRFFHIAIEDDNIHAALGCHMGDARAHQAGTEYADGLDVGWRNAFGPRRAFFRGLFVDEQGADHILGLRTGQQFGEIFAFDAQRGVDRKHRTFIKAGQDRLDRFVIALALFQRDRRGTEIERHGAGIHRSGPTREFIALLVPWCGRLGIGLDPLLGFRDDFVSGDDFVDKALGFCRLWIGWTTHHDHHASGLQSGKTRQALGAAAAGQKADLYFRQAKLDFRIVGANAIMAGQREFEATAERETVQRAGHRLGVGCALEQILGAVAACFHPAQHAVQFPCAFKRFGHTLCFGSAEHVEVGTGQESGFLARCNHRALDFI